MADNVTVDNGALTDFTVAARDSSGVYFPRTEVVAFGSLANGAQTTVSSSAVQIIAANTSTRIGLIVQNVGANPCRVGISGVTATTGVKLNGGESITFSAPACPTNAVYAIRDGGADTTVLAQEITR